MILSITFTIPFNTALAEPDEHWAILIGISDYAPAGSGGPDLQYADDDANDMYQVLTNEHGWKKENIIKLVDSAATKTGIQNAVDNLSNRVNPNDLFLLFYAGHGSYTTDQPPIDEADGFDEYILTHDQEQILDDELAIMLEKINANKIVVIMDSCFSGGFFKLADIETRTVPGPPPESLSDTINGDLAKQGYIVLSASDEDETCAESSILQNGIFTFYLIEGMFMKPFPADFNNNRKVSAEEAYTYAAPRATNFNPNQHAQIWDAIPSEANLTIINQIIGGTLTPSNKLRIAIFYLGLPALLGIFSMAAYKYRKVLKSQFSRF
ncbi:hypothetical protein A3K80_01370 [Candidatus Bathyarchaeota archaeon RBG_13_38_9]|nr:MAG: hypothetical protein A3K80_01370 [Candidatus Bathyarchaeota archaeon RBG_13_38_9]